MKTKHKEMKVNTISIHFLFLSTILQKQLFRKKRNFQNTRDEFSFQDFFMILAISNFIQHCTKIMIKQVFQSLKIK